MRRTPAFIIEKPAVTDKLDGHSRVAKALAYSVLDDQRLQYIGLIGTWGSGKSTVMSLFSKLVTESDKNNIVFLYDAWAHQSDPPRRSFLEELEGFLEPELSLPPYSRDEKNSIWRTAIRKLSKNEDETTTTTTPELTPSGKWMVASLVLLPIGLKLIGDGTTGNAFFTFNAETVVFSAGWILTCFPVVLALFLSLRRKSIGESGSFFALIANKIPESKKEIRVKSTEPTTIEFQRIVASAMSAVHDAKKRLIIVVDNLDRLPADEAIKLWSTIRAMFIGGGSQAYAGPQRPVVIVPVDEKAIASAYSTKQGSDPSGQAGRAFLDKTFDITFKVPPPVQSHWQKLAVEKIQEVLDGASVSREDAYTAISLFDAFRTETDPPTPREINRFVNGLATLHMQWREERVSFAAMAYYQTRSYALAQEVRSGLDGQVREMDALDPDWRRSVAAMHFGVKPEFAYQVMLDGLLSTAIEQNDPQAFTKLSRVTGFGRYFVQLTRRVRDEEAHFSPINAGLLLAQVEESDADWLKPAWRMIGELLSREPYNADLGADLTRALLELVDHLPEPLGVARIQAEWKRITFRANATKPSTVIALLQYMEGLRLRAEQRGIELETISIGPSAVFEGLMAAGASAALLTLIEFDGQPTELAQKIQERLKANPAILSAPQSVRNLFAKYATGFPWEPVAQAARESVEGGDPLMTMPAFESLAMLSPRVPQVKKEIRALFDNGTLQNLLKTELSSQSRRNLPLILAAFLRLGEAPSASPGQTWATQMAGTPKLAAEISASLGEPDQQLWSNIIRIAKTAPDALPIVRPLAANWAEAGFVDRLEVSQFGSDAEGLALLYPPPESADFYQAFLGRKDYWDQLADDKLRGALPLLTALMNSQFAVDAADLLAEPISRASVEGIKVEVRLGGPIYPLMLMVARVRPIGGAVQEALRAISDEELLRQNDEGLRTRWFELVETFDRAQRKDFYRRVLDRIASGAPADALHRLVLAGGASFLKEGAIAKQYAGLVRHLTQPLLAEAAGKAWLIQNQALMAKWIAKADRAIKNALVEQLKTAGAEGEELMQLWKSAL